MTEIEARQYIREHFGVPRETLCARFALMVEDENARQNLIAPATQSSMWSRHIVDSAQLLTLAHGAPISWLDVGTGAGFPGMVIALLSEFHVKMVEPRRRRADFLHNSARALGLQTRVEVHQCRAEMLAETADVVSARGLASLSETFAMARHLTSIQTTWVLPRGKSAYRELETAQKFWQGEFHVERSITHPDAFIVVARGVRRK